MPTRPHPFQADFAKHALAHPPASSPAFFAADLPSAFATPCPPLSPAPVHAHAFAAVSSTERGHRHVFRGFVYPANGSAKDGHVHRFQGVTEYTSGHFHRVEGWTGPAIPQPDGSHVHRVDVWLDSEPFQFRGGAYRTVTVLPRHVHRISAVTGPPLGEEPDDW